MKYKFSVFTPCYNSEKTIHRVFNSLMSQTIDHKDFEWIVINDASTDRTDETIREYMKKADFGINYINLKKNQMLTKNYNLAIKEAKGELFVPIGHDDAFVPEALETFWKYWSEIKKKEEYRGVLSHTKDQYGHLIGTPFPKDKIDLYPEDFLKFKIKGEKRGAIRTNLLKNNLFPEDIDKYIAEQVLWLKLGKYKTRAVNKCLEIYYINENSKSLSNDKQLKYINGSLYSTIKILNYFNFLDFIIYNPKQFLIHIINLSRLSFHKKSLFEPLFKLKGLNKKILYILFSPLGILKAFKDRKEGRV